LKIKKKKERGQIFHGKGQGPQGPALPEVARLEPVANATNVVIIDKILLSFNCSTAFIFLTSCDCVLCMNDSFFLTTVYKVLKNRSYEQFFGKMSIFLRKWQRNNLKKKRAVFKKDIC